MRRLSGNLTGLVITGALLPAPALAKSPREEMFGAGSACYARSYSLTHLAGHPDQRVRWIALSARPEESDGRYQAVDLSLRLRGDDETYQSTAYCENEDGHLYCLMEGDAGAFSLEPARDGAVLIKVARRGIAFEGSRDFVEISGTGGDDKSFLLPVAPRSSCP
jgi:hypothetical protein